MSKVRLVLVPALLLALALPVLADHSWGNYHWARKSNPFTLKVHDNVTSQWDSHLAAANNDWNSSSVLNISPQPNALSSPKRCSSATGVVEVCNARYGRTGWLGIAGISASGGHITKGYTKLNDTYFDTATYNKPEWRASVTCQEIGHDLGLDHQDEDFNNANLGTCMDYSNNPGTNQHPNRHDYDQLDSIYAHLDTTSTVASIWDDMAAANSRVRKIEELLANAEQWGAPVGFDAEGRPNRFILHLGSDEHGEELTEITHVFWAPVDPFRDRGLEPRQHGID